MRNFKLINLIACIALLTSLWSCSESNDGPEAQGTSAKVTVTCVADENNDSPFMVVLVSNESVDEAVVEPGQTFTKEFEVSELPNTAGFAIYPSIIEENGKCEFTMKGEVALMDGKRVVKKETIDEKVKVTDIETDHTRAFLFNVTSEGLQRITDFVEEDEPSNDDDSSSSGTETPKDIAQNYISNIANAYIVTYSVIHEIDKNDYQDPKRRPVDRIEHKYLGNKYSVTNKIYPIYVVDKGKQYYYIEQHISTAFANSYAGVYNKAFKSGGCNTIGKLCEWYGQSVRLTTTPTNFKIRTHDEALLPKTFESKSTRQESFTMGFDGKVTAGVDNKGISAKAEFGVSYSTSKTITYEIVDVTVRNEEDAHKRFGWIYNINNWPVVKSKAGNYATTSIREGADAARGTLDKTTMFLIEVNEDKLTEHPKLKLSLEVVLGSTGAKADRERGSREMIVFDEVVIELPYAVKDDTSEDGCRLIFPEKQEDIEHPINKKGDKPGTYKVQHRSKHWDDF